MTNISWNPPPPLPAPPNPNPTPVEKKRPWGWIAAGVLAILLFFAIGNSGGGGGVTASTTTEPERTERVEQVAPTTERTPTTERVTTTTQATTTTMSNLDALANWYIEHGTTIDGVTDAFSLIYEAAGAGDISAVGAGCGQLSRAVDAARNVPPMPVESVNIPWQRSLDNYKAGADLCEQAVNLNEPSLLESALGYFEKGNLDLTEATTAMEGM